MTRTAPFFLLLASCGGVTLDAGSDHPHGRLPVDERNPVIVSNDGARDNWHGEFAMALASSGHLKLAGIIVNSSRVYPSLESNVKDWRDMVKAAKGSGMSGIPDPTASVSIPLKRPVDGNIDSTEANRSEGARLIVDTAHRLSQPLRPIVVATGGRLTDIADAYLMDPTVADQVVVVASLGEPSGDGAQWAPPMASSIPGRTRSSCASSATSRSTLTTRRGMTFLRLASESSPPIHSALG